MSTAQSGMAPFEHMIKAYFHQDWKLDNPSAPAALDDFAEGEPLEEVVGAREAADRLLERGLAEEELEEELVAIGLEYHPPGDGMTHARWLELVVERLSHWIERRERSGAAE